MWCGIECGVGLNRGELMMWIVGWDGMWDELVVNPEF